MVAHVAPHVVRRWRGRDRERGRPLNAATTPVPAAPATIPAPGAAGPTAAMRADVEAEADTQGLAAAAGGWPPAAGTAAPEADTQGLAAAAGSAGPLADSIARAPVQWVGRVGGALCRLRMQTTARIHRNCRT